MGDGDIKAKYLTELRKVLHDLYDPNALRKSPLLAVFGLESESNPPAALRRIVTDGIAAVKPADDMPPFSPGWRIYHVLTYGYIEQSSQRTVAANLGFSTRQLRRQERLAEEALADHLWNQYHLGQAAVRLDDQSSEPDRQGDAGGVATAGAGTTGNEQELAWLRQSLPSETVDVAEVIGTALRIIAPLIQRSAVTIECGPLDNLPNVAGQLSIACQALLNLLSAAIRAVPGGRVEITAGASRQELSVRVRAMAQDAAAPPHNAAYSENLHMAHQLMGLFGGSLEVAPAGAPAEALAATLVLSVTERVPVLAIDDNVDTLRLFERYLVGSRYRLIGTHDPEQALALAQQLVVETIILDVMLPGVDGWEMLGRLREHPHTSHIPVVVCTILPQEQLALALGAVAFMRKPVSRETLLAALDEQMQRLAAHPPAR